MNELIGKKVVVYSEGGSGEKQDIGTLEAIDGQWVKLRKTGTEVLFFCLYNVRLIKPFES